MSCQVFNPSLDQMKNFYAYISSLQFNGIAKVVPPPEWKPENVTDRAEMPISKAVVQKFYSVKNKKGKSGLFHVHSEEHKPKLSAQDFFQLAEKFEVKKYLFLLAYKYFY